MPMDRKWFVLLSTVFLISTSVVPAGASTLSLNIATPSAGQVLTNHTVNITGTAQPTNTSWVQTSKADFDPGVKDNVTVTSTGEVRLNASSAGAGLLYDDYNDNSVDATRWSSETYGSGVAISETGGNHKISGTSASGGFWAADCRSYSTMTVCFNVSLTLVHCSLSGSGVQTCIGLFVDNSNNVQLGVFRDTGQFGNSNKIFYSTTIGGTYYQAVFGDLDGNAHTFTFEYSSGTMYFFQDGSLLGSRAITLSKPLLSVRGVARASGDSFDARWDNATIDPILRTYDNFNDNSVDLTKWKKSELGGLTVSETGGELKVSGTCNVGGFWGAQGWLDSYSSSEMVFGSITVFGGSGTGYTTGIGLMQDLNNYICFGVCYDPGAFGPGNVYRVDKMTAGVGNTYSLGTAGTGIHSLGVVYGCGNVKLFSDGALLATYTMFLNNASIHLGGNVRANGDTGTFQWENVTIERDRSIYDNFDDNSFDASRWTKDEGSGISSTETGGELRVTGTSNSGTLWNAHSWVYSTAETGVMFADLKTYGGTGTGYSAFLEMRQDANNFIAISSMHDTGLYGGQNMIVQAKNVAGTVTQSVLGNAGTGVHRYGIINTGQAAKVYIDGIVLSVVTITLKNTTIEFSMNVRASGDSINVAWDNICTGWNFTTGSGLAAGNYTSSVHDTGVAVPELSRVNWTETVPAGANLSVSIRSGDLPDMTGTDGWHLMQNNQTTGFTMTKRYIQYKVTLGGINDSVPALNEINITYSIPLVKVDVSPDNGTTWQQATGGTVWNATLTLPDGPATILVRVTDASGANVTKSLQVGVDTTPPTGTIVINDGDDLTGTRTVNLTLSADDMYGVPSMMLSEDVNFTGALWQPFISSWKWTLTFGDGLKTVYVKYRDANGWVSEPYYATILLDTTPPDGTLVIAGGENFTRTTSVKLNLTTDHDAALVWMLVANTPDFAGAQWMSFASSLLWSLPAGDGDKIVYAKLRDNFQRVSATLSDSIILDGTAPSVGITVANGTQFTRFRTERVDLKTAEKNGPILMQLGEDSALSGAEWVAFTNPTTITFSSGDGPKNIYARLRDAAGNEGPISNGAIILDTTPPTTTFTPVSNLSYALSFNISWAATDAFSGVQAMDIQYRDGQGPWTDWLNATNKTSALFTGLGGHTYQFRGRATDRAGNQEAYPDAPAVTVEVVDLPPVVSIVAPLANGTVKGKLAFSGTSYHPQPNKSVIQVQVSIDGGNWQVATGTLNWDLKLDSTKMSNGKHVLKVRAFDGQKYSTEVERTFVVNNEQTNVKTDAMPWILIAVVLVAVVGVIVFLATRKKQPGGP